MGKGKQFREGLEKYEGERVMEGGKKKRDGVWVDDTVERHLEEEKKIILRKERSNKDLPTRKKENEWA